MRYHKGQPSLLPLSHANLIESSAYGKLNLRSVSLPTSDRCALIHKTLSPLAGHTRVIFELPASLWAHRVSVVGDFNQWCPHQTPLTQERDGAWRTALDLPRGQHYHFHYVVDGEGRTEGQADGFATTPCGGPTSLLHLP